MRKAGAQNTDMRSRKPIIVSFSLGNYLSYLLCVVKDIQSGHSMIPWSLVAYGRSRWSVVFEKRKRLKELLKARWEMCARAFEI